MIPWLISKIALKEDPGDPFLRIAFAPFLRASMQIDQYSHIIFPLSAFISTTNFLTKSNARTSLLYRKGWRAPESTFKMRADRRKAEDARLAAAVCCGCFSNLGQIPISSSPRAAARLAGIHDLDCEELVERNSIIFSSP